jgi:hypothetical protein
MGHDNDVIRMDEKKYERRARRDFIVADLGGVPICPFAIYALVGQELNIA